MYHESHQMKLELPPLGPPPPPKLPPRDIGRSIRLDRVTIREIKRVARRTRRTFSDVIYEFVRGGLEATAAAEAAAAEDGARKSA